MMREYGKIVRLAAMTIIALMILSVLPVTSCQENGEGAKDRFEMQEGEESELFGGGNIVKIRFADDAWFGVVYGTEEHPNSIVIVSIVQRYLGVAKVHEQSGGLISGQYPIRIQTIQSMRMNYLFEYNDTNDNDIFDYQRIGDSLSSGNFRKHEPVYKAVDLTTEWEQSVVTRTEGDNSITWEFSLSAEDLPYIEIGEVNTTGKVLEKLEFTFRITAQLNEIDTEIPVYRINIKNGQGNSEDVKEVNFMENRSYKGKGLSYIGKTDHLIEGWDFEEKNTDPHLLLETTSTIGNRIPNGLAKWLKEEVIGMLGGESRISYTDENGTKEVADEENAPHNGSMIERSRRLKNPRIESGSNWERTGAFTWVTNVTTTTNGTSSDAEMAFQVQGHRKLAGTTSNGLAQYRGFALRGGFSYPAGELIYHDPTMESNVAILDIESKDTGEEEDSEIIPGFGGIISIMAIVGVAVAVAVKKSQQGRKEEH